MTAEKLRLLGLLVLTCLLGAAALGAVTAGASSVSSEWEYSATGANLVSASALRAGRSTPIAIVDTGGGHGTMVNSIAAGMLGGGAKLMFVKVGSTNGAPRDVDVATGIAYAVDHGAKVVNLSLSGSTP